MVISYSFLYVYQRVNYPVIKHSMGWFCWENVHRKTPNISSWKNRWFPVKKHGWKLPHPIIEVIEVNGGWHHKSHVGVGYACQPGILDPHSNFKHHLGLSENSVPLNPMVLLIIIPFLNGYFIGNINPIFSDKPICFPYGDAKKSEAARFGTLFSSMFFRTSSSFTTWSSHGAVESSK